MGEKKYKNECETKEKFPFGYPPIPTSTKWRSTIFRFRKHRKQARPILGGRGILV